MALLAARVGNTQTVLGLVSEGEILADWRVSTEIRRSSDEWWVLVRGLLADRLDEVDGVVVCATVPGPLHEWRSMLETQLRQLPALVVEPGVRTGIPIQVDHPREVGTDRIANAVAAVRRYGGPAVVVDFGGTATTFEAVNAEGQYVGGAIAPGIEVSLDALRRRGAQLRQVEVVAPRTAIAKNTVEAVQSGMVFGVAAQVDGLVARIVAELGVPPTEVNVISTGYLASLVIEECRCFTAHSPWLTLQGLELIFDRNNPSAGRS